MSYVRGVLLSGRFRSWRDLHGMGGEDQRNTLITELAARTAESVGALRARNNLDLSGAGAVLVLLRTAGIRDEAALRTMTVDDQRNTLITELAAITDLGNLQGLTNLELVRLALRGSGGVRGVLLAGGFLGWRALNATSADDQRNTLIANLVHLCRQEGGFFQGMDDATLAGCGAISVLLRDAGIRDAATLAGLTADEQRNILIVEIDAFTKQGQELQRFNNADLVRIALGDDFLLRTSLDIDLDGPDPELFLPPLVLRYRGLRCFGETDWDGDDTPTEDEPYLGIIAIAPSGTTDVTTRIYTGFDSGEVEADLLELYRGEARGVGLTLALFEHDFSDPAAMERLVKQVAEKAGPLLGGALAAVPAVGSFLAAAFEAAWAEYGDDIVRWLNDTFDFGDDLIGTTSLYLSARQLRELASAPWQEQAGLQFKVDSPLISGDGASYKAVFDVVIPE
ncbi:hypothetical protein D0Z08_09635 [Nocardioides immobilis]|uniref:Uncharacterized protein n=1 Tax=Nocardioides immobilis TaxID=2049295 RepID=A0A417Y418_9ACTN|nr:hypothetical protein [Nocardioides immobilis]RHW27400.1 hypothetical protein D0Z08_09635 [Nocardioides immobilis]